METDNDYKIKGQHLQDTYEDHKDYCKVTKRQCKHCGQALFWDKIDESDESNWHTERGFV